MSTLKIGADLSFVYTHPSAAPSIKNYSPDLIVNYFFKENFVLILIIF